MPENEVLNVLEGDDAETNALRAKRRCQKCGTAMDSYLIDPKRKLHVCGNNPTCDGYEIEEGEFRIKGYDGPVVECEVRLRDAPEDGAFWEVHGLYQRRV